MKIEERIKSLSPVEKIDFLVGEVDRLRGALGCDMSDEVELLDVRKLAARYRISAIGITRRVRSSGGQLVSFGTGKDSILFVRKPVWLAALRYSESLDRVGDEEKPQPKRRRKAA